MTTVQLRPSAFPAPYSRVDCDQCGAKGGTDDPAGWVQRHAEMHDTLDALPSSALSLAVDATSAGHSVRLEVTGDDLAVYITEDPDYGADWWAAFWTRRPWRANGAWRYRYATNGDTETMTLRELRTWVTDKHHLSRR
jgi:hypothetical protein